MTGRRTATSGAAAPVYAVCGAEAFLRQEAVADIVERSLEGADRRLALGEYDGSGAVELAVILDELRTLPFLAPRRVVVVREADRFITQHRPHLEAYVERPCETGVLVLECRSLPANTRLHKLIARAGEVIRCEAPKPSRLSEWVAAECPRRCGKAIEPQAAALLCAQIGPNLGVLIAELHKLALHAGDQPRITLADVEALVSFCKEEKVWNILSAIAARDEAAALRQWEEVIQTDRAAGERAVAGIAYTVRRLLQARLALEAGTPLKTIMEIVKTWDERRLRAELQAFTTDQVEQMLCELLEADVAAKTGRSSVHAAIESFIVRMCRRPQARRATG